MNESQWSEFWRRIGGLETVRLANGPHVDVESLEAREREAARQAVLFDAEFKAQGFDQIGKALRERERDPGWSAPAGDFTLQVGDLVLSAAWLVENVLSTAGGPSLVLDLLDRHGVECS